MSTNKILIALTIVALIALMLGGCCGTGNCHLSAEKGECSMSAQCNPDCGCCADGKCEMCKEGKCEKCMMEACASAVEK